MAERGQIRVVTPGERTAGPSTPGMERQQAFATDAMWSGLVRTEAGMISGWHHHGEYETTIYVLSGALRMEFGATARPPLRPVPATSSTCPRVRCTGRAIPPPTRPTSSWCALVRESPRSTLTGRRRPEADRHWRSPPRRSAGETLWCAPGRSVQAELAALRILQHHPSLAGLLVLHLGRAGGQSTLNPPGLPGRRPARPRPPPGPTRSGGWRGGRGGPRPGPRARRGGR